MNNTDRTQKSLVWGYDVIIRICQFHIIQALARWAEDRGRGESSKKATKTGKRAKGRPSLSMEAMKEVIVAFRFAQRCRDTLQDPWKRALQIFEGELKRICNAHGQESAFETVRSYFQKNWWCSEWLGAFLMHYL